MKKNLTWIAAVAAYVLYNGIIYATWGAVDASYLNLVGADVAFRSLVLPLGLGALFMLAVLGYFGIWKPVLVEDRPGRPRWASWPILLVMAAMILINFHATQWSALGAGHLLLLVIAGVLVGFNEETLTRGVLVLGFRNATSSEARVWFLSTALFGLMHLPNALFGPGLAAGLIQTCFAFLMGGGLYVLRRLTGGLLLPIAFHGLWDLSSFTLAASGGNPWAYQAVLQFGTYLVALAMVIVVLLHEKRSAAT